MNYFKEWLLSFNDLSKERKFGLVGGLILIASLITALSFWLATPNYSILFNNLDGRDASQIVTQLEKSNISYRIDNQGSDILIDKHLIDKTRLKLMSSGMQLSGSVGFELFDKSDFGLTDFSQKINYQRALQGELERTITSLDEVKQARVHLVIPQQHLFQQEDSQPRAAISLHLNHPLRSEQIKGIQQLIVASVAHMQKSNVVVLDQNGYNLTAKNERTSSQFASKKNMERYLNDKILQMLKPIFNHDEFMVKIDVTLNYDQLQREIIKPEQDGHVTHEKEIEHSTSTKDEKAQTNKDLTREKSYHFGTKKENFTRANGKIERLSISVVIPEFTNQATVQQIERLVKTVVGFDAKRGDTISIEPLIFKKQTSFIPTIAIPQHKQIFSRDLINTFCAALSGIFLIYLFLAYRHRQQKRQLLLRELSDWLSNHD
ncbi:MAG: flagellar M-ring protein FliF [Tatlockia sp.]|nr:flagellar M-ring protein FliF [Tatlockia sp.]